MSFEAEHTHHSCGGTLIEIGKVCIGWADVPLYRCDKCGQEIDASEYDHFDYYWQKKHEDAQRTGT